MATGGHATSSSSRHSHGLPHIVHDAAEPTKVRPYFHTGRETVPEASLQDGQVLVQVSWCVATASAVTVATAKNAPGLNYFKNFPIPEAWEPELGSGRFARSVFWGAGVVVGSRCASVPINTRVFGFFPLSPYVTLSPVNALKMQFEDGVPHRTHVPVPHRTYRTDEHLDFRGLTPDEVAFELAAGGVFFLTGWCMSQAAALHQKTRAATALLLTSGSSRTAYAAAFASKYYGHQMKVIGLTSAGNVEFTRSLGVYDEVLSYESVVTIDKQQVVFFDMAGNTAVLKTIYSHFGGPT